MKNTIKILVALLICSAIANGQISRTANAFSGTYGVISDTPSHWGAKAITYLDSINNLTAQCWFKHNATTGTQTLFSNTYDMFPGISGISLLLQFVGNVENFKKAAHKVFAENAPWLPKGANLLVDVDKYTAYKNDLGNKVMAINAPDIDNKTKTQIIEGLKNELDEFVRNSAKQ